MYYQIILIIIGVVLIFFIGYLIWLMRVTLINVGMLKGTGKKPNKKQIPIAIKNQPKYAYSKLSDEQKEKYLNQLVLHMEKEKSYRKHDLTIAKLAQQVRIPKHFLSQVINEKIGCSFLDFINQYRIKEVKLMLQNPDLKNTQIIDISHQVGFKAKSTFYAAFKKYTHRTPAEFRRLALMNQ